ncbi:hypothetical protein L9F63_023436 [Diploptera punctata]|uniref:Carboxylic ester hydrolase n=1 Tax=Diploptera punctata TaxID=6984 RepID=A0AAD7ZJ58_DIPPU|nr:hypothetical protein L9F63_023436 [Diploptera punctata]
MWLIHTVLGLLCVHVLCISWPIVNVRQGPVQGVYMTSRYGRTYSAFQGIPYAQPPIGELRFQEPVPAEPWPGVWNASVPGSMCLQWMRIHPHNYGKHQHLTGDEDCLFLNVYTPQLPSEEKEEPKLKVFVYIHGGAFMYGWGHEYGASILMDRDAVLVTINYRLGPLGFLTTGDGVVPGNMGLKDQATALKWVKSNIAAFGGDPDSITITGTSAGGASVSYYYLSPWSRDTFHQGISQSGSALCGWAQMDDGPAKAKRLAALVGCDVNSNVKLVDCLHTRPARQIVQQVEHFQVWMYNPYSPFAPTVEKGGPNPFLSKHPVDVILEGKVYDVPWLVSATVEDGLYPAADWVGNKEILAELNKRFAELAPHIFHYNYTVPNDKKQEVVQKLREYYLQNREISLETIKGLTEMCTDRLFLLPVVCHAKLLSAVKSSPTKNNIIKITSKYNFLKLNIYFYMFNYRGKYSFSQEMSGVPQNFGVSHLDDTMYTMDYTFNTAETEEDRAMSNFMLDVWMAYAKTGVPIPDEKEIYWLPTSQNEKDLTYFWDLLPINEPQMRKTTPFNVKHTEL